MWREEAVRRAGRWSSDHAKGAVRRARAVWPDGGGPVAHERVGDPADHDVPVASRHRQVGSGLSGTPLRTAWGANGGTGTPSLRSETPTTSAASEHLPETALPGATYRLLQRIGERDPVSWAGVRRAAQGAASTPRRPLATSRIRNLGGASTVPDHAPSAAIRNDPASARPGRSRTAPPVPPAAAAGPHAHSASPARIRPDSPPPGLPRTAARHSAPDTRPSACR